MTHDTMLDDGHNNLTPAVAITRNVPRPSLDVCHAHGPCLCCRRAADAAPECNGLAGDLALERPENEAAMVVCSAGRCSGEGVGRIDVEAGPVDAGGRCGQGVKGVPEERSRVRGIAISRTDSAQL